MARGLTPGTQALVYGLGSGSNGLDRLFWEWHEVVTDTDNDGVVTFTVTQNIPWRSIWAVVDLRPRPMTHDSSVGMMRLVFIGIPFLADAGSTNADCCPSCNKGSAQPLVLRPLGVRRPRRMGTNLSLQWKRRRSVDSCVGAACVSDAGSCVVASELPRGG